MEYQIFYKIDFCILLGSSDVIVVHTHILSLAEDRKLVEVGGR